MLFQKLKGSDLKLKTSLRIESLAGFKKKLGISIDSPKNGWPSMGHPQHMQLVTQGSMLLSLLEASEEDPGSIPVRWCWAGP
jgi:hypothetical protein